jgi:hypothetical protein
MRIQSFTPMQRIYSFVGKSTLHYWPEAILLLSVVSIALGVYFDLRDLKTHPSEFPVWLGRWASVVVALGVVRTVFLVRERLEQMAGTVNMVDAVEKAIDSELAQRKGAPLQPHEIDALRDRVLQIAKALVGKDLDAANRRARFVYEPYLIIGGTLLWGWGDWLVTKL